MKVLFFTDLHADKIALKELIKKSKEADLIVCAGDLSVLGKGFGEMLEDLDNIGKKILIIPGNNETPNFLEEGIDDYNNFINIHDSVYQDLNIKFLGIGGGTISPFNTPYEMSEGEFNKILSKHSDDITVLVSHTPPKNTILDKTKTGLNIGSTSVLSWIKKNQPKICCCGHLHENSGKELMIGNTLCFNPGKKGRIIKL
jgi:hypothetical protein